MRAFAYQRPDDSASAIQAFRPNAQFLAGGTTLLDLMKLDVMRPDVVIDINGVAEAHSDIGVSEKGLRLGALTRMADAAAHPLIRGDFPVIAQSLELAASPQLRNMATLGGNVLQRTRCSYFRDPSWQHCNKRNPGSGCAALDGVNRKHAVLGVSDHCIATYPGDFAQALMALDASLEIAGPDGARTLAFEALHRQPGDRPDVETTLKPGELILAFVVPTGAWTKRSLYLKIRDRQSYEFALASAAVALEMRGPTIAQARIALGGVAAKPWRAREAEAALAGKAASQENFRIAAQAAFADAQPRAGNRYKIELGKRTLARALSQAVEMKV
jgi:xanthine dehydrogenase YagS FAD-binding subunit